MPKKFCQCQIRHQKVDFSYCRKIEKNLKTISIYSKIALIFALENPHCVCELMNLTNLSQTLISHYLSDFEEKKLVFSKPEGRFKRYFLTEKGKKILAIIKSFNF